MENNQNSLNEILGFDPVTGKRLSDSMEQLETVSTSLKNPGEIFIEEVASFYGNGLVIARPDLRFTSGQLSFGTDRRFWIENPTKKGGQFTSPCVTYFYKNNGQIGLVSQGEKGQGMYEQFWLTLDEFTKFSWERPVSPREFRNLSLLFKEGDLYRIILGYPGSFYLWCTDKDVEKFYDSRWTPEKSREGKSPFSFTLDPLGKDDFSLQRFDRDNNLLDSLIIPNKIDQLAIRNILFTADILNDPLNTPPDFDTWQFSRLDEVVGVTWDDQISFEQRR